MKIKILKMELTFEESCFPMERYCTELQEEKTFCQIFRIVIVNSSSVAIMRDRNRAKGL